MQAVEVVRNGDAEIALLTDCFWPISAAIDGQQSANRSRWPAWAGVVVQRLPSRSRVRTGLGKESMAAAFSLSRCVARTVCPVMLIQPSGV